VPDDRDPYDDIAHLDFDVDDPDLVESLRALEDPEPQPAGDPRNWAPTEDVDDGTWVLSEEDQLLQQQLDHRRHRRGLAFRIAASLVAIGLLALSLSTLLGRRTSSDDTATRVDQDRLDFGPTSAELSRYLVTDADVVAVDPTLELVPGNTDGSYDNRSFDELNRPGPSTASYGAEAGVVRTWRSEDDRSLVVAIYMFADRGSADRALVRALAAGGERRDSGDFALLAPAEGQSAWRAARAISRFLVSVEADGVPEDQVEALVAAVSTASAAVH
jgi:hypothetical protein